MAGKASEDGQRVETSKVGRPEYPKEHETSRRKIHPQTCPNLEKVWRSGAKEKANNCGIAKLSDVYLPVFPPCVPAPSISSRGLFWPGHRKC